MMGHNILFGSNRGRIGIAESHSDYETFVKERDLEHSQEAAAENQALEETVEKEDTNATNSNIEGDLKTSGWA